MAHDTPNSPRRVGLRVLCTLLAAPERYNIGTLAAHLELPYDRVRDIVEDIAAEFGVLLVDGQEGRALIRVMLPGETVAL